MSGTVSDDPRALRAELLREAWGLLASARAYMREAEHTLAIAVEAGEATVVSEDAIVRATLTARDRLTTAAAKVRCARLWGEEIPRERVTVQDQQEPEHGMGLSPAVLSTEG